MSLAPLSIHIDLRTPPIRELPRNLLADDTVLDQTFSVVSDALRAAAQNLLSEIAPRLALDQGDLTMFAMDVPPEIPPHYAPIVVAEAKQRTQESNERTIGVCKLIASRPESRESALNSVGVVAMVWGYLGEHEQVSFKDSDFSVAKMTLVQAPKHGTLDMGTRGAQYYASVANFEGSDDATFLVEIGGYKVTVKYYFKVIPYVGEESEQGSPYDDKSLCPKGRTWRISFDENDSNAPIYSIEHPYSYTNALAGYSNVSLTIADLPHGALGQTTGTTITIDDNAAGHGWFIDSTPWSNEEYLPTHNPISGWPRRAVRVGPISEA